MEGAEIEKFKINKKDYKKVLKFFNKKLCKAVLEGHRIVLPARLGKIRIKKLKTSTKRLRYDYGHYNKTGQKLYHLNEHSDGFYGRWFWMKASMSISGQSAYSFEATWTNKRAISSVMNEKGGHKRFME